MQTENQDAFSQLMKCSEDIQLGCTQSVDEMQCGQTDRWGGGGAFNQLMKCSADRHRDRQAGCIQSDDAVQLGCTLSGYEALCLQTNS